MLNEIFLFVTITVIIQRFIELFISHRNEKWLLKNGSVEFGKEHYKYIVLLHILFFVSMYIEFYLSKNIYFFLIPLILFLILQIFKIWLIISLGKFWNTKIFRIPGSPLIKTGLYKYFKHPNYFIVICEIFILPLIFGLYITSIIFSIFNAIALFVRIRTENEALKL
jgi:methyltransferase